MTPKYKNLAEKVIRNTICAANENLRFDSIEKRELPSLTFSDDVLTPSEEINDLEEHNTKNFGLIVPREGKQGVLIPNLENIKSVKQQLKVCLKKDSFKDNDTYELFQFKTQRFM